MFALRQDLHLARLGKLRASTADLLEKGAQVLEAHNTKAAALAFLDEAQILYLDLGHSNSANRLLAVRTRLMNQVGTNRQGGPVCMRSAVQ